MAEITIQKRVNNAWSQPYSTLLNGARYHDTFDESLTEAQVSFYNTDLPFSFETWDKTRVVFDQNIFEGYVIGVDESIIQMGNGVNGKKLVEMKLIEYIQISKYIVIGTLVFTNEIIKNFVEDGYKTVITKTAQEVVERISNQLYVTTLADIPNQPFQLIVDNVDWWIGFVMPEMSFTGTTLFEALVRIGEAIGGFPYLELIEDGQFYLRFQQWDNKNIQNFTDENVSQIESHDTIENRANVLDSTVQNLKISEDSDTVLVYPSQGGFIPLNSEYLDIDVDPDTAKLTLPYPIKRIIKVEIKIPDLDRSAETEVGMIGGLVNGLDVTEYVMEQTKWETLTEPFWGNLSIEKMKENYRNTRCYYSQNGVDLLNVNGGTGFLDLFGFNYCPWGFELLYVAEIQKTFDKFQNPFGTVVTFNGTRINYRVTYEPLSRERIQTWREGETKPIAQIINQQPHIIEAKSYGNYLQGLTDRMIGKYKIVYKMHNRGTQVYNVGSLLNGEYIVEGIHTYSPTEIISRYTTAEEFNRRNEFISIPHNIRQWEIPEGGEAVDRHLNLVEDMQVSINSTLPPITGSVRGLLKVLDYDVADSQMTLAYVGFKESTEITTDDFDYSDDYGLLTMTSSPLGNKILMTFETHDNASIGDRHFYNDIELTGGGDIDFNKFMIRQYFVGYNPICDYLNIKFSADKPSNYIFNSTYTNAYTAAGDPLEGNSEINPKYGNANFANTFPMSNKSQYTECNDIINLKDLYIQKDLSEKLLFSFQLDFVGKNGTIVYNKGVELNGLCNAGSMEYFKVYIGTEADGIYGKWDLKPRGIQYDATIKSKTTADGVSTIIFNCTYTGPYTTLCITDANINIMFATNTAGAITNDVSVSFSNQKKIMDKL